ncbi:MAG: hypothetical protein EZS28_037233 [Streblomastix strix]|uniref:Uncharacterized protein n=1 Tax=Streblomastix strix TaxID=222440 RepID=A0A5J4UAL2_9EUKA|nr:MAG: hypothetical protein EZS28_037233 [Streblomastix strix]
MRVIVKLFENLRLAYFFLDQLILDLSKKRCFLHRGWERYGSLRERLLLKLFGDLTCKLALMKLSKQVVRPVLVCCVVP